MNFARTPVPTPAVDPVKVPEREPADALLAAAAALTPERIREYERRLADRGGWLTFEEMFGDEA